ncbi:efflux RND transporter periplasmic adaptor subunit [Stenotrophomonas sp. NLF4-10]|uniref:efflux RND transporter periplasmic adaptor subunit n=1 Tax=Stenotrophomonas sp. NLF4-10 TaxID=2918754 RepID=UPI001EFA9D6C|nr:efflux RND transporter periplasmic adaptor subunit [Stenotrophomonas sp. NLF4-10]MCG8274894.1 efflux RND transporter periplasmic adaptor subunit [Stenotrophomonas sp. NLF4-10]
MKASLPISPMFRATVLALLLVGLVACGGRSGANDATAAQDGNAHADDGDDEPGHDDHDDHDAGQTTIPAAQAHAAGIVSAAAGPGTIADEHEVQGLLAPIDGRTAQVTARFPGPIRALRADVGDAVRAGQPLAAIDSNLSLTTYTIAAPISGVVLSRQAQVGGVAGEGQLLFEIGDLSRLWVDLHIFGSDTQHITAGVPVTITRMTDGASQATTLERVLPGTATASQSTVARATIGNDDGLWRPGAAVRARIVVASTPAEVVVPLAALQDMEGREVVFVREGDTYRARPVTLGARDATQVAVTQGLRAGEQVVVEQSYTVKADIGKAGAGHEH